MNKKVVLEREGLEKRAKRRYLQNIILSTVSVAGIISVALIAPNAMKALEQFGLLPHKRQAETIENARKKLIKNGLLKEGKDGLQITEKGRVRLFKEGFYQTQNKKSKKWDKKWRVLIFDIPEKLRYVRDNIRTSLINIGFMKLQDSVWVYPYDCEEYISLLKGDAQVGDNVLYMIVDHLENDESVREYFGLK